MSASTLEGRRILLAVSGGIAAYKSAELCRLLLRSGAEVQVMMTAAAQRFVGEATFAALSGRRVATSLFDPEQEEQIGHIRLADRAELLLVAPATANLLARFCHGIADDLVSTVYLAHTKAVLIAPAMNVHMWAHPATQRNVAELERRERHRLVGPEAGEMACGHRGPGRMAEPTAILAASISAFAERDLDGLRLLVSAGGTREAIDPVRFIGNRSTGRMGYAVAEIAARRGAEVTLISGPSSLAAPPDVTRVAVTTAAEMMQAIKDRAAAQDVVVMAAAVADYRPVVPPAQKIKKDRATLTLELERTEDILALLGSERPRPLLVGFAAETSEPLEALAKEKLARKGCDLMVANNVAQADAGFGVETNRVLICERGVDRAEVLPLMSKREVAGRLLDRVLARLGRSEEGR